MHTFSIVLVLLLEQHAVPFVHNNLLVVHTNTDNNLLWLVQVFWYAVLHWDEINNQLHDIIVALIWEVILWFHPHKTCHSLQFDQLGAIVHFLIWGGKEPIEILHLLWWVLISRPYVILHTNVCYHVIHSVLIIAPVWLNGCGCLHLSMLLPHQVVRYKFMLSNMTRHFILRQHPSILAQVVEGDG
jgi:hypothetical protein